MGGNSLKEGRFQTCPPVSTANKQAKDFTPAHPNRASPHPTEFPTPAGHPNTPAPYPPILLLQCLAMNQPNLTGKVCLVTGANAGIGKATATGLARMGATVVMVCRSRERGETAQAEIAADSGSQDVDLLIADLSSQGSIRKLARSFSSKYSRLNVLINNAGTITHRRRITVDGIETQFAVNHLAPFLLTNLLVDTLKASAPARVVTVSSQVHSKSPLDFDDLRSDREYVASQVYRKTKLANILFTYELARRLEGTSVAANCLHPGVIATKLLDDYMGGSHDAGFGSGAAFGSSPEQGASVVLHIATSPDTEGISGKYFYDNAERKRPPLPTMKNTPAVSGTSARS